MSIDCTLLPLAQTSTLVLHHTDTGPGLPNNLYAYPDSDPSHDA